MHALSVRLSGKRMYIAHLAARLESMESGRTAMDAVAYRLFAKRMKVAMSDYPAALLAAQLGRACPSVVHALEQRRFESSWHVARGAGPPGAHRHRGAASQAEFESGLRGLARRRSRRLRSRGGPRSSRRASCRSPRRSAS